MCKLVKNSKSYKKFNCSFYFKAVIFQKALAASGASPGEKILKIAFYVFMKLFNNV